MKVKKYKVLVTARSFGKSDLRAVELLQKNHCQVIKLEASQRSLEEQLAEEIVDADAVIAGLEDYTAELMESAKNLKVISRYGVGYDKVDVEAAKKKHIAVTITPGANGDSVADLAVALMLEVARNLNIMDQSVKSRNPKRPSGLEMYRKTVGIIGTGRIGRGVGKRCRGFDMDILCYDTYEDENFKKECGAQYVDLDTLLSKSDFITIHCPLTPETKNMIGKEQFEKMRKTAILVNTARGGIVDEEALYEALAEGQIRGAGLDATVDDPPFESPLLSLDNCILTPHAGAATTEASSKMSYMAAENVLAILHDGTCEYQV